MSKLSLLREWWHALSTLGKVVVAVSFGCTFESIRLAVVHPDATLSNFLTAMAILTVCWVAIYAVARDSLAQERLSDPEYLWDDDR